MQTQITTNISEAIALLNQNEVVALPTETVYGLAGNALNTAAVAKIFEAKQRPHFNPLIVHVASINQIENYAYVDELSWQLANTFMPGPLTLLLPKKSNIPSLVTAGSSKVAIRIPAHKVMQQVLQQLCFPLAAPSANTFKYVSPVTAQHVYKTLQGKIPLIVDGGISKVGLESTIVEVQNNEVLLHRVGGLPIETIEKFIGQKVIKPENQKIETAGQLKSHYATHTPLYVGKIEERIAEFAPKKIAIISLDEYFTGVEKKHHFLLSQDGSLTQAAQNLFNTLQLIDEKGYDVILATEFANQGLGIAINDRLSRAQVINKQV